MEISGDISSVKLNLAQSDGTQSKLASLQNLSGSKGNYTAEEKKNVEKASRGFESMFFNMMLKQMRESSKVDEKSDELGFGADTLQSLTDMQLSDYMSKMGKGIGIAESVYKNLTGESLPNAPTEKLLSNYLTSARNSANASEATTSTSAVSSASAVQGNFSQKVQDRLSQYETYINNAADKYDVPSDLIKAVITAESAGKNNARSSVGAQGLMQLMPATAKDLGVKNAYDPEQNINGGAKYLKMMLDKFEGNTTKAVAAYNAGPGAVDKYNGVPPYKETQAYVKKVSAYREMY